MKTRRFSAPGYVSAEDSRRYNTLTAVACAVSAHLVLRSKTITSASRPCRCGGGRFLALDNRGRMGQHNFPHHDPVAHG